MTEAVTFPQQGFVACPAMPDPAGMDEEITTQERLRHDISSRVQVLEVLRDLYDQELPVTTPAIIRVTGLKHVTVTDCLKELKERGEIWCPERGVYRPVVKHPPSRAVSRTTLPDGTVKLEVGDEMLTLTPRESRLVAEAMGGTAAMLVAIESASQMAEMVNLARRIVAGESQKAANAQRRAATTGEGPSREE